MTEVYFTSRPPDMGMTPHSFERTIRHNELRSVGSSVMELQVDAEFVKWTTLNSTGETPTLQRDEVYVIRYYKSWQEETVIEREANILTLTEANDRRQDCGCYAR